MYSVRCVRWFEKLVGSSGGAEHARLENAGLEGGLFLGVWYAGGIDFRHNFRPARNDEDIQGGPKSGHPSSVSGVRFFGPPCGSSSRIL